MSLSCVNWLCCALESRPTIATSPGIVPLDLSPRRRRKFTPAFYASVLQMSFSAQVPLWAMLPSLSLWPLAPQSPCTKRRPSLAFSPPVDVCRRWCQNTNKLLWFALLPLFLLVCVSSRMLQHCLLRPSARPISGACRPGLGSCAIVSLGLLRMRRRTQPLLMI